MTYGDFIRMIKSSTKGQHFEVRNSYGAKAAWRWLKKQKWLNLGMPVTETQLRRIIRGFNQHYRDRLLKGDEIDLPHRMGKICVRVVHRGPKIVDSQLILTNPVNWEKTIRLWYDDDEAFENRTLVRNESGDYPKFIYKKRNRAFYKNQMFYTFTPSSSLRKEMYNRIKNGLTTVPKLYYHELHRNKRNS